MDALLTDIITTQSRPLDVLITAIIKFNLEKHLKWWTQDQTCNFLTSILNLMAGKSLINIIDIAIGERFYPPLGALHYQTLCQDQFHGSTHINCEQKNKSEIKNTKQYPVNTIVLQNPEQIRSKKPCILLSLSVQT